MIGALVLAVALPGLQLKVQTTRADWYVQPGLKVNVAKCEESLVRYEKIFGVQVPHFEYVRVRTAADVGNIAGIYGQGTVVGLRVISTQACSSHEMVHLVTRQLGVADALSEEGVAVLLAGDTDRVFGWTYRTQARERARQLHRHYDQLNRILRAPEGIPASEDDYLVAEGWVRHLLKEAGQDRLVAFFRASDSLRDSQKAFTAVYGTDAAQAFDAWLYGNKSTGSSRK